MDKLLLPAVVLTLSACAVGPNRVRPDTRAPERYAQADAALLKNSETLKRISILGAGKIGQAVGRHWVRAGHRVCFGVRSPEKLAPLVEALGSRASAKSIEAAAAEGDLILLAVPYPAVDDVVKLTGTRLAGKIVLDATNPFGLSPDGRIISTLGTGITAGSPMAKRLPKSTVVRCFTHVMDELLVSRGSSQPGLWAMAIAGDDPAAKQIASQLVCHTGFLPVDIGTLAESAPLEPGGILFPHMFTESDMRVDILTEVSVHYLLCLVEEPPHEAKNHSHPPFAWMTWKNRLSSTAMGLD